MKSLLATLSLALILGVSQSAFLKGNGSIRAKCPPKPPTVADFDKSKYLGEWYQVQGTPSFFQPSKTSCVRATYADMGDGRVSVRNVAVSPSSEFEQICGYAEVPDPEEPGALEVHFPGSPAATYWVIGTDYENYASVYSCKDLIGFAFEYSWVLVRDANPSEEVVDDALAAFKSHGLPTDKFEIISQKDCGDYSGGQEPCKSD